MTKRKKDAPVLDEEALTARGRHLWHTAERMSSTSAERAEVLAAHLGACAGRAGWSAARLAAWLQGAYGTVWVGPTLSPGLDAKDVRRLLEKARQNAAQTKE